MITDTAEETAALVEAVREGDREAFAKLYRTYANLVRVAVRDQLRDPNHVADAVQETFARALASIQKLRDPERFRPWLMSIARHTAIDIRRDGSRLVLSEPENTEVANGASDLSEVSALREVSSMVDGLVGGLSRRDAIALRLVTLGFDVADVATALGIKHGAAKVVLHRARRRLRAQLVLQLLASGVASSCAELPLIVERDGLPAAGRHAEICDACCGSARRAIYD